MSPDWLVVGSKHLFQKWLYKSQKYSPLDRNWPGQSQKEGVLNVLVQLCVCAYLSWSSTRCLEQGIKKNRSVLIISKVKIKKKLKVDPSTLNGQTPLNTNLTTDWWLALCQIPLSTGLHQEIKRCEDILLPFFFSFISRVSVYKHDRMFTLMHT